METEAALADGVDDVLDRVPRRRVQVVVVLPELRVSPAGLAHPEPHRGEMADHGAQHGGERGVLGALAVGAARAVEAEAEQPLPVDAVEAQRPREGVQRAREQREHRLVLRQPRFLREMGVVAVLLARLE